MQKSRGVLRLLFVARRGALGYLRIGDSSIANRLVNDRRSPPMLIFYFAPGSSSMAAHIALHEVAAPVESRAISFARREHRTPEFLAINPEGKVPTLVIDGRALTEVAAILYYLAKRFPAARLLPDGGAEAEAQAI